MIPDFSFSGCGFVNLSDSLKLPSQSGVYLLVHPQTSIVGYVGASKNLRKRLSGTHQKTKLALLGGFTQVAFWITPDPWTLEAHLIDDLKPHLNLSPGSDIKIIQDSQDIPESILGLIDLYKQEKALQTKIDTLKLKAIDDLLNVENGKINVNGSVAYLIKNRTTYRYPPNVLDLQEALSKAKKQSVFDGTAIAIEPKTIFNIAVRLGHG